MEKLERRKNLKTLITLAIPIILEEILTTLLQYVDTAMVGRLGAQATSSVSLTTSVNWLIGSCFGAIGIAVVAIMSSALGAGDKDKIRCCSSQIVKYILVSGLLIEVLAVGLSPVIPIWMQADKAIQKQASIYFCVISLAIIFRAANVICASAMRALKDTRTPMYVNLAANILNVILNYLFIYTAGLGVTGAAIATSISSTAAGISMFLLMRRKELLRSPVARKLDRDLLRETARISLPALATSFTSCMGHIVFAALVSSLGTTVFAAHAIALSAETIFYLPGYGLRSATSTLIGISVGEDDREKFRVVERQSIILTLAMMTFTGLMLFLFADPLVRIFTPDAEVIRQGAKVLKLIAFCEPFFGLMIVCEGIYYGLGQTRITFIVETIGSWGIRILATIICVHVLHTSLFEIWICMFADDAFRAIALAIPVFSGKDLRYFEGRRNYLQK